MGKREPIPEFTDVVCLKESCKFHIITWQGMLSVMASIKLGTKLFEDTSAAIAAKSFVNVQVLSVMTF